MTETKLPARPAPAAPRDYLPLAAYVVAAVGCVGVTIHQLLTPTADEVTYSTLGDWVREITFVVFLLANMAGLTAAHRARFVPALGRWLATAGYALILVGVSIGMVLRDDPEWFMALGGPGLLLSTVGWITVGVLAWRRHLLPGRVAAFAGVGGAVAIIGSAAGLTVLLAAFWIALAARSRAGDPIAASRS